MKFIFLVVPSVIALWVPFFNFRAPAVFGIPFFYWFQLLLIPISAIGILIADRLGRARA